MYEGIVALRNLDGLLIPLSGVRVSVFDRGTTNLAAIYQGPTGASQGPTAGSGATNGPNPFTTGPSGAMEFWCDGPDTYDILIHDLQGPPRLSDRTFGWNCFPSDDAVIVNRMIGDAQVTTAKIGDNQVTTAKILDGQITLAKISSGAQSTLKVVLFRTTHTFSIAGEINPADIIPPFFVALSSNQLATIVQVRHAIASGTQVIYNVLRNGSTLYTGHTAEPTPEVIDVADQALADGDRIAIDPTTATGAAVGLSVAIIIEHTIS